VRNSNIYESLQRKLLDKIFDTISGEDFVSSSIFIKQLPILQQGEK